MKKIISLISLLSVSVYPVIFAYTHNIHEVKFDETIFPLLIAIAVATFIFTMCLIVLKDFYKSLLSDIIFMLLYWNYGLIEKVVNSLIKTAKYWHVLPVVLVIFVHIVVYIKHKKVLQNDIYKLVVLLGAIFMVLSIFNISSVLVTQAINENEVKQKARIQDIGTTNLLKDKPNVYYIILDEYGAFDVMKEYYQYDNSDFKDFLVDKGFTVSKLSSNNVPNTVVVIPNLLNYNYVVQSNNMDNYKYKENSALFNLFKNNGYNTYAIDTLCALSPTLPRLNADIHIKLSNTESSSNEFAKMVLSGTILKIADVFLSPDKGYFSYVRDIMNNSFSNIEKLSKENNNGRFIFAHIMSPHEPFVFDKNGNYIDDNKNIRNWEEKKYYLEQYIYITNRVKEVISNIIKNDSDSIIIIQSDHSMRTVKGIKEGDKVKILNSVYYRGEKFDSIDNISGLNTLRMILSRIFVLNLPLLED